MVFDATRTSEATHHREIGGPIRFVDVHSGRGGSFPSFEPVRELVEVVAVRMEAEGHGRRFPLLHVVGARRTLTGTECEALVWELARLRTILSTLAAPVVEGVPSAPLPRRTMADVYGATLSGLDLAARLGAASRRGARFEAADAGSDAGPAGDSPSANPR